MLDTKQFLDGLEALEQQGITKEITIKALSEAFETIVKKKHVDGLPDLMVKVEIVPEEGRIDIFNLKNVVEEVTDDAIEISLEDAKEVKSDAEIGSQVALKVELDDFTKQDAMKFKSILKQKIKEAEKAAILALYSDKIDELITGYVEKIESKYTLINIGRTSVILSDKEKIGDEQFSVGQAVKVYLAGVGGTSPDSGITISRACGGFLRRLFEEEIHDVYDGTVIIKDIAREAGERAKVSVTTNDINVDPVGACIGPGGSKIQKICSQINHEKIDIIQYHEHKGLFIAECLKPAVVLGVKINEDGSAVVIVKDGELRVAIGRRGVNARLAVKLAGCKIDIKEETQAKEEGLVYATIDDMKKEEDEMILAARRQALIEQIAREEEARKKKAEEDALKAKQTPVIEEIVDDEEEDEEDFDDEEYDEDEYEEVEEEDEEEEPVEVKPEEKEIVKPVVKEETPVEYKPVIMQSKVSLDDLEKQIEEEKKKKNAQNNAYKKKSKVDEEKKETQSIANTNRMDIYTQEELDELDAEEYDEDYDDEDINYDDYDEYYEDN